MNGSNEFGRGELQEGLQQYTEEWLQTDERAFHAEHMQVDECFFHADEFNRDYAGSAGEPAYWEAGEEEEQDARGRVKRRAARFVHSLKAGAAVVAISAVVLSAAPGSPNGSGMENPRNEAASSGEILLVPEKEMTHTHTPEGEWITLLDASCDHEGRQVLRCSRCGHAAQERSIPMLEHVPGEHTVLREPDCTHMGLEGVRCERCGAELESVETEMGEHIPSDWITDRSNTCQTGERHKECTVCGTELERESVPASHQVITLRGYDAVCGINGGVPGLSEGKACERCDAILVPQTVIQPTHTLVRGESRESTCEEGGYLGELYCTKCEWVEEYPQQLAPLGHLWVDAGLDVTGAPLYRCTRCGMETNYP